jgi:hypothetical protein
MSVSLAPRLLVPSLAFMLAGGLACDPSSERADLTGTGADSAALAAASAANKLFAVRVDPHTMALEVNQSGSAKCTPTTKSGTVLTTACTWTSSNANRVTIVGSGQQVTLVAKQAGTATVIATAERKRDSVIVTVTDPPPPPPPPGEVGVPFGPFALFVGTTTQFAFGPAPFTMSYSGETADRVAQRIAAARAAGHRLIIAMTGGAPTNYTTDGKFDLAKWKAKMDTFRAPAVQQAVADGVADGTVIMANIIDEPNTSDWGGVITRQTLDEMSAYVKEIFPSILTTMSLQWSSLVNSQFTGPYTSVDVLTTQYVSRFGSVEAYRDGAVSTAKANNLGLLLSLNIINGGTQDKDGVWDCVGTGGKGTGSPNCRVTPSQLESFGTVLGLTPETCGLLLWRYDDAFFKTGPFAQDNVAATERLAAALAGRPRKVCGK